MYHGLETTSIILLGGWGAAGGDAGGDAAGGTFGRLFATLPEIVRVGQGRRNTEDKKECGDKGETHVDRRLDLRCCLLSSEVFGRTDRARVGWMVKMDAKLGTFILLGRALLVPQLPATVEMETTAISKFRDYSNPHSATVV
jgi:hypothetical protein